MDERPSLGSFLRSCRERTAPAAVGLPHGGRRRTPGLRREELATLAGVSVDYLARLEQNRERRPSASVLAALSGVLGLNDDERAHLLRLVAIVGHQEMCPPAPLDQPLDPAILTILEGFDPNPALVRERLADVAAWNNAYYCLMRPAGVFDHDPPNLARHTFLHPAARHLYEDWSAVARAQVAQLHSAAATCTRDTALDALVADLQEQSGEFARLWARHEVAIPQGGPTRMEHPEVGRLEFDVTELHIPDRTDRQLLVYLPASEGTAASVARLTGGPRSITERRRAV